MAYKNNNELNKTSSMLNIFNKLDYIYTINHWYLYFKVNIDKKSPIPDA